MKTVGLCETYGTLKTFKEMEKELWRKNFGLICI